MKTTKIIPRYPYNTGSGKGYTFLFDEETYSSANLPLFAVSGYGVSHDAGNEKLMVTADGSIPALTGGALVFRTYDENKNATTIDMTSHQTVTFRAKASQAVKLSVELSSVNPNDPTALITSNAVEKSVDLTTDWAEYTVDFANAFQAVSGQNVTISQVNGIAFKANYATGNWAGTIEFDWIVMGDAPVVQPYQNAEGYTFLFQEDFAASHMPAYPVAGYTVSKSVDNCLIITSDGTQAANAGQTCVLKMIDEGDVNTDINMASQTNVTMRVRATAPVTLRVELASLHPTDPNQLITTSNEVVDLNVTTNWQELTVDFAGKTASVTGQQVNLGAVNGIGFKANFATGGWAGNVEIDWIAMGDAPSLVPHYDLAE